MPEKEKEKVDLSSCRLEWDEEGRLSVVCPTPEQVAEASRRITEFGVHVHLAKVKVSKETKA